MGMTQSLAQELARIALWLLLIGNIFAVLVGLLLVVAPQQLARWSRLPNKWISTQAFGDRLEQMHDIDRYAFRRPRLLGVLLLAGAVFILLQGGLFVRRLGIADGGRMLATVFDGWMMAPTLWEALWLSLVILLAFGALLALLVGLLGLFGQAGLHGLVRVANRWISTRRSTEALDSPHYWLEELIRQRPRLWGAGIVLLGTYAVASLLWFWHGS